ncbi:hypothetical protein [Paraburkholderia metrosideri]|uniref:Integrase catalytic domain-containing protein n=1 Tax=Paraburkholderia metrosideri TaxID=580937 RepID=A0ABN7HVH8_9BURK|nr:hypothetical protein [Paraburkholderia metrosideri]CAD6538800.1 hypothetical protein LMG28140_03298 [Paraburkholderia metrosideri]
MSSSVNNVESVTLFPKNSNLILLIGKRERMLVRYLGEDASLVYLVRLGTVENGILTLNRDPDTKKYRMTRSVGDMRDLKRRELVWKVDEAGIPQGMKDFAPKNKEEEKALKSKRQVVDHIVRVHGDTPFKDKKVYALAVGDAANRHGCSEKTVRKYYEHYLFYGEHEFALADRHWDKGAPGVPRFGVKGKDGALIKSGRKTFAQVLDPLSKHSRMQFPVYLKERLTKFVQREAHVPGATITGLARKFLQGLRGHNRGPDEKKQSFPVDPRKLPSERNTIRHLTPIFKAEKAKLALLHNSERGRGYSAQIARGDLNVVDIDGTVADCFLRVGDATVAINGVLKPTVLLAVDRSSRAILGWYVTYRAEDADSYLACVFSACTDKEDELARWGVSHLDGMVYGSPSSLFVDRGPGISEKVQRALVGQMRQRLLMAAPGEGKAKGDVEQMMDYFQEEIAELTGATHGEPVKGKGPEKDAARKRNREKLRKATAGATLTLEQFMCALLTAISKYNLNADMRRLRNRMMLEGNVPPVPKYMFLFNLAMRAGDAVWELTEDMVIRKLAKRFETTAPQGFVSRDKREFTSVELQKRAIQHEAMNNGRSLPIVGYELFTSKLHALWDDNGHFVELEATEPTLEKFGIAIPDIRDYIQMRDVVDLDKQRDKTRKHPTVQQAVKRGGVSQTTQRRMAAADGLPRTVNNRSVRKTAEAHAGAAHTRALLGSARKSSEIPTGEQLPAVVETEYRPTDAQEVDIDF